MIAILPFKSAATAFAALFIDASKSYLNATVHADGCVHIIYIDLHVSTVLKRFLIMCAINTVS